MKETMQEIKDFSCEENVEIQMDNARYHWKIKFCSYIKRIALK